MNPTVKFGYHKGEEQSNVAFFSGVDIGIKLAGEESFIWSDQFMFDTMFDFRIEKEVLMMQFFRMDMKAHKGSKAPKYNGIDMTPEDYEEFLYMIDANMDQWLEYLNETIFLHGVPLPMWNLTMENKFEWHDGFVVVEVDFVEESK
jgi:hypothetical protein